MLLVKILKTLQESCQRVAQHVAALSLVEKVDACSVPSLKRGKSLILGEWFRGHNDTKWSHNGTKWSQKRTGNRIGE